MQTVLPLAGKSACCWKNCKEVLAMLPKYLSAGCGIAVERRYHNINPVIVISPAGELIGYRLPVS